MKNAFLLICLSLFFPACQETIQIEIPEPQHFELGDVLNHLPFDQFNNHSIAIFKSSVGKEIDFNLSITENAVEREFSDIPYSTSEISFKYESEFSFNVPNFSILATVDFLLDKGKSELIYCNSHIVGASIGVPKLTIFPNTDHENTILNEEFTWMSKEFENVYSNVLIQENENDKVKIYYQSSLGIIGFVDNANNSWVLDRFE